MERLIDTGDSQTHQGILQSLTASDLCESCIYRVLWLGRLPLTHILVSVPGVGVLRNPDPNSHSLNSGRCTASRLTCFQSVLLSANSISHSQATVSRGSKNLYTETSKAKSHTKYKTKIKMGIGTHLLVVMICPFSCCLESNEQKMNHQFLSSRISLCLMGDKYRPDFFYLKLLLFPIWIF